LPVPQLTEHRRLSILRHLECAPEYTSNASILLDVVMAHGIASTHDQIRSALTWLAEQELIVLDDHGHVMIAVATERGADVARGRVVQPGVKRPSAGR